MLIRMVSIAVLGHKERIFMGDIAEMKNYVVQYLVKTYNYDYDRAKDILRKSRFSELIDEDTEYVLHYGEKM